MHSLSKKHFDYTRQKNSSYKADVFKLFLPMAPLGIHNSYYEQIETA